MLAAILLAGVACGACGTRVENSAPAATTSTSVGPCLSYDQCGVTFEQLKRDNNRYAQRLPFAGDPVKAEDFAARVRVALAPLGGSGSQPTVEAVQGAMTAVLPPGSSVQVTTSARGLSGTAFGVVVAGGCVFGNIAGGVVTVSVGGYIHDGGCLAVIGH